MTTPSPTPSNYCTELDNGLDSNKCPCAACKRRRADRQKLWRHRLAQRQHGVELPYDQTDPEKSTKAITHAKNDLNVPFREISRITGVNCDTIQRIYHQRTKYVWRRTEEAILAHYGPDAEYTPRAHLPQSALLWEDYRWMLECLYAQGWTQDLLTQMIKDSPQCKTQGRWLKNKNSPSRGKYIESRCADELLWLVETIEDKKGPSKRNRTIMARSGVFPLIHYTEEGKLIRESLTPEQRAVQSKHGKANSRSHGSRPRSGSRRGS